LQDTLIAIEALSEFAYRETNRDFYKMTLYMTGTARDWGEHVITLNKTDFAHLHMYVVRVSSPPPKIYTVCRGKILKF
jgi:hypothetical protein